VAPYELPPPFQGEEPPRPRQAEPIPAGCHAEALVRQNLVIGGSLVFGLPYAGSVLFGIALAAFQSDHGGGSLSPGLFFVPVIGPYVALAEMDTVESMLIIDAIAQTIGVAMIVAGVAWKKTVIVPDTTARVTVTPMRFGRDGTGLALAGRF
jgi:hypothetical protein